MTMTITLRVQYKGDAARKLLHDANSQLQDPPYLSDVIRALSLFQIPPPDNTRPIFKSGFILCNYETTSETRLYDSLYRGARRAQSIACRKTLDGLSISYIHMFENGRPISFASKYSHQYPDDHGVRSRGAAPYEPRRRSFSPVAARAVDERALHAERTWPLVASRDSMKPPTSSAERMSTPSVKHEEPARSQPDATASKDSSSSSGPEPTQATLDMLSKSQFVQALLHTSPPAPDRPIKREEAFCPILFQASPHPNHAATSVSAPKSTDTSAQSQAPNFPRFQAPHDRKTYNSYTDMDIAPDRSVHTDNRISNDLATPNKSYTLHRPSPNDQTYSRDDRGIPNFTSSWHGPTSSSASNRVSRFDNLDESPRTQHRAPSILSSSAGKELSGLSERRISPNGYNGPSRMRPRSVSPLPRNRYENSNVPAHKPLWTSSGKRPLSPGSRFGDIGSTSPPYKRRDIEIAPKRFEPYRKFEGRSSFHAQNPTEPRSKTPPLNRPDDSSLRLERPEVTSNRPSAFAGSSMVKPVENTGAIISPPTEDLNQKTLKPNARTITLNRELWDIRRQITALKARENNILDELKQIRAPELPQTVIFPKTNTPEEKMRSMEAEIVSLRDRLQKETMRRKLVEESCESERRRRKHAEDMLDDARREYQTPLVLPAMMDAFQKISRLTGDALTSTEG